MILISIIVLCKIFLLINTFCRTKIMNLNDVILLLLYSITITTMLC